MRLRQSAFVVALVAITAAPVFAPAACVVPADYDRVVRALRMTLHLTQTAFAA